jgi:DNA-binding response OmpR family regulator
MESRNGSEAGIRVLLIEDDPLTREVLAMALAGTGYDVRSEADGSRVERVAETFVPDIALIDLDLGAGAADGITVAKRLRAGDPIPFVFLTAATGLESVLAAFDAGADDYVVKPFIMAELLARMRAVLRRRGREGRRVFEVGDLIVDEDAHSAVRLGTILPLTQREFSLLSIFAQHPGMVLSKVQLLNEVWGYEHYDLNVVEVHISALRRKLEECGPRLIYTVRGVGYVLRPPRQQVIGAMATDAAVPC